MYSNVSKSTKDVPQTALRTRSFYVLRVWTHHYLCHKSNTLGLIRLSLPIQLIISLGNTAQFGIDIVHPWRYFALTLLVPVPFVYKIRGPFHHYNDVIMSAMASQITSLTIVCSTVYSRRKSKVRGIHRWPVNSPHKGPVARKMFAFGDVITRKDLITEYLLSRWYETSHTNNLVNLGKINHSRMKYHHTISVGNILIYIVIISMA